MFLSLWKEESCLYLLRGSHSESWININNTKSSEMEVYISLISYLVLKDMQQKTLNHLNYFLLLSVCCNYSLRCQLHLVTAWMACARYPTFTDVTPATEIRPSFVMYIENSLIRRSTWQRAIKKTSREKPVRQIRLIVKIAEARAVKLAEKLNSNFIQKYYQN